MNQDAPPAWLVWVVPLGTVIAALWAFLRRFFAMATREELKLAIEKAQEQSDLRHRQNQDDNAELKEQVSEMKAMVARIEGQLSGRYPHLGKRG
jgi:hypothetical protein